MVVYRGISEYKLAGYGNGMEIVTVRLSGQQILLQIAVVLVNTKLITILRVILERVVILIAIQTGKNIVLVIRTVTKPNYNGSNNTNWESNGKKIRHNSTTSNQVVA